MSKRILLIILAFAGTVSLYFTSCSGNSTVATPNIVSYNFHIRPLLSDKCFACHGPDANKEKQVCDLISKIWPLHLCTKPVALLP